MIRRTPIATRPDTLCPYTTRVRSRESGGAETTAGRCAASNGSARRPRGWHACGDLARRLPPSLSYRTESCRCPYGVCGRLQQEYRGSDIPEGWLSPWQVAARRSEEHTSELQSLMRISYAVFCLKKKKR